MNNRLLSFATYNLPYVVPNAVVYLATTKSFRRYV